MCVRVVVCSTAAQSSVWECRACLAAGFVLAQSTEQLEQNWVDIRWSNHAVISYLCMCVCVLISSMNGSR